MAFWKLLSTVLNWDFALIVVPETSIDRFNVMWTKPDRIGKSDCR